MKTEQNRMNAGFTLVEMLIVVAIIAILIAVSIPMVNSSLEAARDAADQSNERSAKAVMMMVFLGTAKYYGVDAEGNLVEYSYTPSSHGMPLCFYDAASGRLIDINGRTNLLTITPYGQCRAAHDAGDPFEQETDDAGHKDMVIVGGVGYNEEREMQIYIFWWPIDWL